MTDGVGSSGNLMTIETEREWIENTLKSGKLCFAIINLENDELIGNCGIENISYKNRIATVGIFIGKKIVTKDMEQKY